ncbi:YlxR family protein [Streptomyces sp. ST2-7A]|uniref:YlxR family protein n=1 Tax=Streptomyces sp. ST2-7A TaxID=2907214 RepID=UPI001F41077E|nr:YlxR family protein [Streptomyces sp. ST2-7A]MCE7080019.1 YlxR family protein [Streptomyces sp. ST2-7A]
MSGRTHVRACPERTCVGCRERSSRDRLLRVALEGNTCVPDPRGTLPGRGAYLHPAPACLEAALRRRAFPRAFRRGGLLDTAPLERAVRPPAGRETPHQQW